MKVTSVNVFIKENARMKGIASITLDDCLVIHDMRIIEGENGLFVAMPSRKTPSGEYKDVVHPTNSDFRKVITDAVLEEYNKQLENFE